MNKLSLAVKKEIETIMLRHPSSTAAFRELYNSPSMESYNSDCETFTVDEVVYDAEERSIYQIIATTSLAQFVWM